MKGESATAWMDRGNCRSYVPEPGDPWPWDTDPLTGSRYRGRDRAAMARRRAEIAGRFCHNCPVQDDCLAFGIRQDTENDILEGVWGGLTPGERAEIQGRRTRWVSGIRKYAKAQAA